MSAAERESALGAHSTTVACGFMRPSAFDAAVYIGEHTSCETVVMTSVFDAYDELMQPSDAVTRTMSHAEQRCFFAFVDQRSYDLLSRENREIVRDETASAHMSPVKMVGVWRLVLLDGRMPFSSARRNSRVPKMLAHRLFPHARYALWVDSKLVLHQSASVLRRIFLPSEGAAVFAAFRNLRRDHVDQERDWIWHHKCGEDVERCGDLIKQWTTYEAEQRSFAWAAETVAIEGSVLLQDLRSPIHNALFCNWFNEYVRFGERDQISMAYVLHRMGLTAKGANATPAVRFIDRSMHYLAKPSAQTLRIVRKVGHRSGSRKVLP